MKSAILQLTEQHVSDSTEYINGNVADHLIREAQAGDNGYLWFLSHEEIEEFENNPKRRKELEAEIESFIRENFNYDMLEITISDSYCRIRSAHYMPTLSIKNDGTAHIGNSTTSGIDGGVWHGTSVEFDTNRLTVEMVKEIYEEVGKISWETKWNGSNWVGCEKSEEMERRIGELEGKIRDRQMDISFYNIDGSDFTTLLEEQTIIKEWSELNEDNIEAVAVQIHESMYNYEDDNQIYMSDVRDVESAIRDYADSVK